MSHKKRMRDIGRWIIPREGTPEREALTAAVEARRKYDPSFDVTVKDMRQSAVALAKIQEVNGAGLLLDSMIREYNAEYNNRSFNHSLRDMPSSFNVMEAFNRFLPPYASFCIAREQDYLLSFIDFLDFVTSDASSDVLHG